MSVTASDAAAADAGVRVLLASLGGAHAGGGAWSPAASDARLRLSVCTAPAPGSGGASSRAFRGVATLPYSVETLRARTLNLAERLTWDKAVAHLGVVRAAARDAASAGGAGYAIFHSVTKPAAAGVISGRDFCDAVFIGDAAALPPDVAAAAARPLAAGAWVNAGAGLREHAAFPATKALVRGFNNPSGWLVEPADPPPDGDGGARPANSNGFCRVTYLVQPELGGWLPSVVVNAALTGMFAAFFGDLLAFLAAKDGDLEGGA